MRLLTRRLAPKSIAHRGEPGLGDDGAPIGVCDQDRGTVLLPHAIQRTLSEEELDAYRAPFAQRAQRLPTLAWPREIPIDGMPADVVKRVEAYDIWLGASTEVPKLLLTFDPGAIMTPETIRWCQDHVAALEVKHIGPGIHFVQEDSGPAIGIAIAAWREKHGLVKKRLP